MNEVDQTKAAKANDSSWWRITCFYVPLAIQAFSQSLTHLLVASVVSHGPLGAQEQAAFAQGNSLLFLLGALGSGMVTTGMVFGRSRTGMENFYRLNLRIAALVALLQALICVEPFAYIMFAFVLKLEGDLAQVARMTTLLGIPMQSLFFIRNRSTALLYNEKRSGLSNTATMARIGITAVLSTIFVKVGLTGYFWGAVAMTLPLVAETVIAEKLSRPFLLALPDDDTCEKAPIPKQLRFTIPLSMGGTMLALSGVMVGVFLARVDEGVYTLPVHYIMMGVINPIGFAAMRTQAVTIAFPPAICPRRRLRLFCFAVGLTLSLVPLLFTMPSVARWYFGKVQNLDATGIRMAAQAMAVVAIIPLLQALRGHAEGMAALRRRPNAIMAGQAMYLATIVILLFALLETRILPGYLMGGVSIMAAIAMSQITVRAALVWNDFEDAYGAQARRAPGVTGQQR
ncbi:MAG: hypothetical protein ACOX9C_00485 [Kiritimatiellia bacterium]|jgi:uncharacterized membrane protein YhdT